MLVPKLNAIKKKRAELQAFLGLCLGENRAEGQLTDIFNLTGAAAPYLKTRRKRDRYYFFSKNAPATSFLVAGDTVAGSETAHFEIEQGNSAFTWRIYTGSGMGASNTVPTPGEAAQLFFKQYAHVETMGGKAVVFPSVPNVALEMGPDSSTFYTAVLSDGHASDPEYKTVTLDGKILFGGCVFQNNLYCFGRQVDKQGKHYPMVFVSALGDPVQFTPDGTDAGAFAFPVSTDSDFTAVCAFKGSVYFFTNSELHEVYGDYPSNYSSQKIHNVGCLSMDSVCELSGVLYFADKNALYSFTGGSPVKRSGALEDLRADEVLLCPGRETLYMAVRQGEKTTLYTYMPGTGLFYKEETGQPLRLFTYDGSPAASDGGVLQGLDDTLVAPKLHKIPGEEAAVRFRFETGDLFRKDSLFAGRKRFQHIVLRFSVTGTAFFTVSAAFDGQPFRRIYAASALRDGTAELPLRIPPCKRLRIAVEGTGDVLFTGLAAEGDQYE